MDRFSETEHTGERGARSANAAWLAQAVTWFGGAIAGMAVVFIGLAVDAYRHNHGAGEETLLSFGNPGHLIAGIGLAMTSISALAGFSVAVLKDATSTERAIRRFVPVTAAWVALSVLAAGSLTYIAASGVTVGHSHDATAVATAVTADDAGGVARALSSQGINADGGGTADPKSVPGGLTQGVTASGDHVHDHGKQPTFTQLESMDASQVLALFPANTVSASDLPTLKTQVEQVRKVAETLGTVEAAKAAGYVNTTSDVPYMGQHYLNFDLVRKGVFDPAHPQGLLFSKIGPNGEEKLVGVWFLLVPGINGVTRDTEPAGFVGNLDLWHAHVGLCLVGLSGASEGETKESCTAKGGSFTADLRWMMHVWVAPEQDNPDGVFAYLNNDLFQKQQAASKAAKPPSGNLP